MKKIKLGKIAFVAGAVMFSALVGAEAAVDLKDATSKMIELNGVASTAATQLAKAEGVEATEMAKFVQAVVKYEVDQGAAAVERLKAALAAEDSVAAKKAMKDLKDALAAAKNALKKQFPKNLKELVDGTKIIVPVGVSQNTVNTALTLVVTTGAAGGAVNPNANLTESKNVQGVQDNEANLLSGASGLITPPVNGNNDPGTGV